MSLLRQEWNWYFQFLSKKDLISELQIEANQFDQLLTLFSIACIQENICGDSTRQLIKRLEYSKRFLVKDSNNGVTPTDEVNSLKMFIDKFLLNIKSNQIAGKLE